MILDSIKNAELYYSLSPRLKDAFEWLEATDLTALPLGINEIVGKDIFVNILELELKKTEDAPLEIHDKYLDVQVIISGCEESFGWSERADVCQPREEFDVEKDVQFFLDKPQTIYTMKKGQFSLFLPEDAHAPMIGTGLIRKAIVKVRL